MAKKKPNPAPAAALENDSAAPPSEVVMGAVERVPVGDIVRHPKNIRHVPITDQQRAELIRSVREVGVLNPVLLASLPGGKWGAIAGWQRVCAAEAVGHPFVPAIKIAETDDVLVRLSMVENALRADMHLVDQWRQIDALMKEGVSLESAAATLGRSVTQARRLQALGRIEPKVLDAIVSSSQFPTWDDLTQIARAAPHKQIEALKVGRIGKDDVSWRQVAQACRVTRIPRARALFGKEANVTFVQDLFAEPGTENEWQTEDVAGFMAAQRAAVDKLIDKLGERAVFCDWQEHAYGPKVPAGWSLREYPQAVPKALPKSVRENDRLMLSIDPDGRVVCRIYELPKPPPARTRDLPGTEAADRPQRQLTDAGLQMAATMKRTAWAQAITDIGENGGFDAACSLLAILLGCLAAQNVRPGAADKYAAAEAMDDANVNLRDPNPYPVAKIAAATIAEMLVFPAPKTLSSDPVADDLAFSIGADAYLPRCDTPEFLAQCSGAMLRAAAATVEWPKGQKPPAGVAKLREFLAGKLPDWRPVRFVRDPLAAADAPTTETTDQGEPA